MPVVCNKFDGPGIPASNMLHTTASSPKKQALGARRTRTRGPKASRHIKDAPHNQRKGSGFVRPGVRGRPQPHNRGCVQPAQGRRRMMGERPAAGICRANGKSAIMDTRAGMAQWQSNGFVNRGLGVRLPLPAPEKFFGVVARTAAAPTRISPRKYLLTCACGRFVSMDTPGWEVYVDNGVATS